jgi:hypothetical protein
MKTSIRAFSFPDFAEETARELVNVGVAGRVALLHSGDELLCSAFA